MTFTSTSAPETVARALASWTSALSKSFFNCVSSTITGSERGIRDAPTDDPFCDCSVEMFICVLSRRDRRRYSLVDISTVRLLSCPIFLYQNLGSAKIQLPASTENTGEVGAAAEITVTQVSHASACHATGRGPRFQPIRFPWITRKYAA